MITLKVNNVVDTMKNIFSLISGLIFGVGLTLSGMTDRFKVQGFLDLFGQWDASLAFVMAAALCITLPGYYLVLKNTSPLLDSQFFLPSNSGLDKKLIVGAIFFGIGWGLYGYCPGPAIASLSTLDTSSLLFVASMLLGMVAANILGKHIK